MLVGFTIIIFGAVPSLISFPAIKILMKRRQFTFLDFGIGIYAFILWGYFTGHTCKSFYLKNFSSLVLEPIIIILVSIIITYSKILLPEKTPRWIVSCLGILMILLVSCAIYFFMPPLGSE